MNAENETTSTKLCTTCGTRVGLDAKRCLVCGAELGSPEKSKRASKAVQGSRMPEITVSLPAALGLLALFLTIGAVLVYFALQQTGAVALESTATPTVTETPTVTITPTPMTPTPTFTPLPTLTPLAYTVQLGDDCGKIAFAFGVSIQSIVLANNLPADCSVLIEGQQLFIPQPTATATPLPTSTFSPEEATVAACPIDPYTVEENDTLSSISLIYNVPMADIREWNGMVNDVVRFGQVLDIPLCRRNATPGPTSTPTPPPPYPPVNLLLPPDGAPFSSAEDTVTLKWASVGTLRENEAYAVTVEDVTEGVGRKLVDYVEDTKFIVPESFRPNDNTPHVIRWWVLPVRQTGTDEEGNPIWDAAGAASEMRVFTWFGIGSPPQTPEP